MKLCQTLSRRLYTAPIVPFNRLSTVLLLLVCLFAPTVLAQAQPAATTIEAQVNLPYVIQFGFGSYDVGGLSTNSFRVPTVTTFNLGPEKDDWRIKLTGYLGYSHANFETYLPGRKLSATQDYLFILPQVELLIPLQDNWTVKPYLATGLGWGFNGSVELAGVARQHLSDNYDFLYAAGVSNVVEIPLHDYRLSLGSKLGWAHVLPLGGTGEQSLATFQNGLELRRPLGVRLNEKMLDIAGSFIYYFFFPPARFSIPGELPLEVSHQYEFGANIGFDKPNKVWIFENPRIGASYRFGDGMTGFRVNFGFPF